ncbi:MAG TPA: DtxR family transcriptional regulator [Candidatus Eisenbacteria bacterium]|uniref:DtxR family transcriptional regulator n=1 Tax=Eiseniibacteriota bacterium TaxID=2212470 RepID=A0A7V2AU33_UNCEI|nr:DtxR family transcriptional regulator [Candidatus Eisenbacteria bacterium]
MNRDKLSCHDPEEEVLEMIWLIEEEGLEPTLEQIMAKNIHDAADMKMLERLVRGGFLRRDGEHFRFTESGRERGEIVIRRHRLAERLLVDVLSIRDMSFETTACRFEHVLTPEVTDHICTLLGHPRTCPHGKTIPPGPCCLRAEKSLETVVVRLSELGAGESGRITYISTADHHRLDRLSALGVFPGRLVRVHQSEPLFVIFLGETQLALEKEIVGEIFVIRNGRTDR